MRGHIERMGEKIDVHRVLVGKLEEKRPIGRCRHRRNVNIKVDVQEVEWFA